MHPSWSIFFGKQRRAGCISASAGEIILLLDNARIVYDANGQGRTPHFFVLWFSSRWRALDHTIRSPPWTKRLAVYINQARARGSAEQGTSTPILAQTCASSGLLEQGNIFLAKSTPSAGNLLFYWEKHWLLHIHTEQKLQVAPDIDLLRRYSWKLHLRKWSWNISRAKITIMNNKSAADLMAFLQTMWKSSDYLGYCLYRKPYKIGQYMRAGL